MGNGFIETSVNKIDPKKFEENYNKIDWGNKNECHECGVGDIEGTIKYGKFSMLRDGSGLTCELCFKAKSSSV